MSDTGKNSWKIALGREDEKTPEYSTRIEVNIYTSDDSPPPLVTAISESVAEIIKAVSSPADLERIGEWLQEVRASHQRKVDQAGEALLSRPAAPRESSRRRKPARGTLKAAISDQKCYRCGDVYGRADVSGCSECAPIRALLGIEVRE